MNKLPLYVWCVGAADATSARLHDWLEPLVEHTRFGTASELRQRLAGNAALPDVALIEHWDPTLAAQLADLPCVWLDPEAAGHDEITVTTAFDSPSLVTALTMAVNIGRARHVADALLHAQDRSFAPSREPLPDLDDFTVHFQAQWSIDGRSLTGAETLLRWNGLPVPNLRPEALIAAAEQRGDIRRLGDWIIHRACRHAAEWDALWPHTMRLLLNISPLQLASDDFAKVLGAAIDQNEIDPALIELEIPVAALERLAQRHVSMVADLFDLGIGFALDGLGAELLDPGLLTWLPATAWKLDRSLIARLPDDRPARALISTLAQSARAQRIMTVAVGVETEAQRALLADLGCDAVQGFLFAEALAPEQFNALLAAHAERPRTMP